MNVEYDLLSRSYLVHILYLNMYILLYRYFLTVLKLRKKALDKRVKIRVFHFISASPKDKRGTEGVHGGVIRDGT